MSRVATPSKQFARSINTAASAAARATGSPLEHNAGATLMPKYADLLRNRRSAEHTDSSRGLTTTHRPTPQPSIANRSKPLMQTFHTSPSSSSPAATAKNLDSTILPSFELLRSHNTGYKGPDEPRIPITPDNMSGYLETSEVPVQKPQPTILAADPDKVESASHLAKVDTVGLDGVELKFVHEDPARSSSSQQDNPDEPQGGMLRDLWKGMVDDVFGGPPVKKAA